MKLYCIYCGKRHLDRRWWAHKPHKNHTCLFCGEKFETKEESIGTK